MMFALKFAVFLLISSVLCSIHAHRLSDMHWKPGDVIRCKLVGNSAFFKQQFYMLGGDTPNHVITALNDGDDGRIEDLEAEDFIVYDLDKDNCWNMGKGTLSREETIRRARKWIGTTFNYNRHTCNSRHWTNYWSDGKSGGEAHTLAGQKTSDTCPV